MKRPVLVFLSLCVCGPAVAEEGYTTLAASDDEAAASGGAAAGGTADAAGGGDASASAEGGATVQVQPPVGGNICAAITCSGHGTCVPVENRAVCACEEGYMPAGDAGLSCVPYVAQVSVLPTPQPTEDPERKAALEEFQSVLPGFPAYRYYRKYAHLKKYGRAKGNFADYMAGKFSGQKAGGIAMLAVGGVLTGAGTAFLVIGTHTNEVFGSCYDDYYDEYDYNCHEGATVAFLTFGTLFSIASVVMYAVGIPKLIVGNSRLKKVEPLRSNKAAALKPISDFNLSFAGDPQNDNYGLVGGFRF